VISPDQRADHLRAARNRVWTCGDRSLGDLGPLADATFASEWLLPRAAEFEALPPYVDLRIMTNNNRVDLAGEGLDLAIRYGDGAWHGTDAVPLLDAQMTPLCAASLARRLTTPGDLGR